MENVIKGGNRQDQRKVEKIEMENKCFQIARGQGGRGGNGNENEAIKITENSFLNGNKMQ